MNDDGQNQIVTHESECPVQPAESPIVLKEGGNIACTALVPEQMTQCQDALTHWCELKIESMQAETKELMEAYTHAKERKWKTGTLKKHADLAASRVTFYEKMLGALRNGYVIVPNFPVSVFAIRTDEERPKVMDYNWVRVGNTMPTQEQEAPQLEAGEGEYKNPFPHVFSGWSTHKDSNGVEYSRPAVGGWQEMNFPVTMAKPEIMRAADRTMALKLFDDLGILPAQTAATRRAKGDPIIVGRLHDPRGRIVTFMIAWHLDTRVL